VIPILTKALQEQQEMIEAQQTNAQAQQEMIERQQAENDALRARLDKLDQRLKKPTK
jgi:predicted RNase H-like nuclease (RuvC/YqgF family)